MDSPIEESGAAKALHCLNNDGSAVTMPVSKLLFWREPISLHLSTRLLVLVSSSSALPLFGQRVISSFVLSLPSILLLLVVLG